MKKHEISIINLSVPGGIRMRIEAFFLALLLMLVIIAFFPDLFPYCSCCKKIKFKAFFRINKAVKIRPGYSGSKSVCRKCCRRYDIETLEDFQKVMDIRRKIELKLDMTVSPEQKPNNRKTIQHKL
jgi:hypothetical protein